MPDRYRGQAIRPHTAAFVCRDLSQFSSIKSCGSERRSASSARPLISRRGLARGRERIADIISDGREESENHAQTNYSQSDKNEDRSGQRLLAGGIAHVARSFELKFTLFCHLDQPVIVTNIHRRVALAGG